MYLCQLLCLLCLTSYNYCNKTFSTERYLMSVVTKVGSGGGVSVIYLVGGSLFYWSVLLFVYLFTEGFLVKQRRA